MAIEERINNIKEFRGALEEWANAKPGKSRDELRRLLNEKRHVVEREVREAGCLQLITSAPPPAVGGLILRDINPFDVMFESIHRRSPIPTILDMLDQTIGVMSQPAFAEESEDVASSIFEAVEQNFAFIAMPMDSEDPSLVDTLDAIKEGCKRVGINAERIDDQQSNERITDRVLESIRRAEYVIADLTNSRPNVYYEAGYALGHGNTPIYIARAGTELEFDLKDYPVLFFDNYKQLKDKLEERIRGIAEVTPKNA